MIWYSKQPPIYIFINDIWCRESDNIAFLMTQNGFVSDIETIQYNKKNKLIKPKL